MEDSGQASKGSAFPSFLGEDPYPTTSEGRPTTSSSNATSEFDATKRHSDVSGLTGPVGEPGLPPSRPTSNAPTEQSQSWQRGSVRGSYTSAPSRRALPSRGGEGSRPTSPMAQTHVPSLTAQGFLRPMSPQKLQAQRGQTITPSVESRVQSPIPVESVTEEQEQEPSFGYGYNNPSSASVNTERDARRSPGGVAPSPPNSRGLSVATSSADGYGLQSTAGPGSVVSRTSATALTTKQGLGQPKLGPINGSPPPMSPKSFRASLGLGSKHSSLRNLQDKKPSRSHEKLHSSPQSPITQAEKEIHPTVMARRSGRNYEYFAGNMLFFCSGRFMNTRASPLNVATLVLTVLPAVLFFAFSAPWLWHNISPAIPIIFAYLFLLSVSAFLHAALSDPGILPRNLHPHPPNPDEERDPLTVGPATTEWVMVKTFPSQRQKVGAQVDPENGQAHAAPTTAMEVPTKYCKSCGVWRPPRAHHCRVCDACIETQDHHCVWLNNCVGRRNYRFFFSYVGFSSILALMLLTFSLVHIGYYAKQNGISFAASLTGRTQERIAFAMFIYSILALPYPGSLLVYHLFLVSRGETTREYLNSHKFKPNDRHRPFSQAGLLMNWRAVLMRPRPPSYMGFKRHYIEGDNRLGYRVSRRERIEKAKREATRRDGRVDGLKNRFSVPRLGTTTTASENGGTMEMKQLSPSIRKEEPGFTSRVGLMKKNNATPGHINSTPR